MRVVSGASKFDVLDDGRTAASVGHDVVEFEKACLGASAGRAYERTAPAVARPHRSFHSRGDVARA